MITNSKAFRQFTATSIFYAVILTACATTQNFDDDSSTKIDPSDAKNFKLKVSASKSNSGTADYKFQGANFKAHWISCTGKDKDPYAAVLGISDQSDAAKFCNDWSAQALLQSGFNVITVLRSGKGQSTGSDDFGGPQSVTAAVAGMQAGIGKGSLVGLWAYDHGTITASFTAKTLSGLKWLMVGNGFYDLEVVERTTKNESVSKTIAALKAKDGEAALEHRSIAWDTSKLPDRIAIYHARNDDVAVKAQADAFNDQLRTIQAKVTFEDIEGASHDLPWQAHFQIAMKILKGLPK